MGADLAGKACQALHKCKRTEKEFTPGKEIIYGIARVKIFFQIWYLLLCPSVWTYGVTIPIKLLKCARRLGIPQEHVVRRANTPPIMPLAQVSCQIDVWKRIEIWKTT